MKQVLFITGSRADWGKMVTLATAVHGEPDFHARVFVTGTHLQVAYGHTAKDITALLEQVKMPNQAASPDLVLAKTLQSLSAIDRPDLVVIHGDRMEALAGAIYGLARALPVAHIEGGERSGSMDEATRHAVTKLATHHFVANDEAAEVVAGMGEDRARIKVIGSPDLDVMLNRPPLDLRGLIPFAPRDYGVLCYHPVTTLTTEELNRRALEVAAAADLSGQNWVVITPNNDPGHYRIEVALRQLTGPRFYVQRHLQFEGFLAVLRNAKFMLGNSSAGVREAPAFGVPSINVGSRQRGRYECPGIADVPEDRQAILDALKNPPQAEPDNHFGEGQAALKFMEALASQTFWEIPVQK